MTQHSAANPTISKMSHSLTTSMPITNFTFKAILKELVSLVIGNRIAFCLKPPNTPKTASQPSTRGVSPTVMPVATALTSTSLPPTMSHTTPAATSSGSAYLPPNSGRGPPQARHQAAVSQGVRFKTNRPVTSQALV